MADKLPEIIFRDDALIAAVKPPNVLSEQSADGNNIFSLVKALTGDDCLPVHRLDKTTGGLMLLARSEKSAAALSSQISAGKVKKEYLTVIDGAPSEDSGLYEDLLYHDVRKNKSYVVSRERRGVRQAALEYKVLGSVTDAGGVRSLIWVGLITGRTHQIRVQFSSRGTPLYGDNRYGSKSKGNIALWSSRISLTHPFSGEALCFSCPPPDEYPWNLFSGTL